LQGKPFVGERIEVQIASKAPSKEQVVIYKQSIRRDSRGQIRIETHFFSKLDAGETRRQVESDNFEISVPERGSEHYIALMDCNTNRTILVDTRRRTEQITNLRAPTAAQPAVLPYGTELFQNYANMQIQDLGFAEIAGIQARGFKFVLPVRTADPDKPSAGHEAERWISQEWALTLKETSRKSETNFLDCMKVLVFRAEEPAPASFELPPDYKVEITPTHSSNSEH